MEILQKKTDEKVGVTTENTGSKTSVKENASSTSDSALMSKYKSIMDKIIEAMERDGLKADTEGLFKEAEKFAIDNKDIFDRMTGKEKQAWEEIGKEYMAKITSLSKKLIEKDFEKIEGFGNRSFCKVELRI